MGAERSLRTDVEGEVVLRGQVDDTCWIRSCGDDALLGLNIHLPAIASPIITLRVDSVPGQQEDLSPYHRSRNLNQTGVHGQVDGPRSEGNKPSAYSLRGSARTKGERDFTELFVGGSRFRHQGGRSRAAPKSETTWPSLLQVSDSQVARIPMGEITLHIADDLVYVSYRYFPFSRIASIGPLCSERRELSEES